MSELADLLKLSSSKKEYLGQIDRRLTDFGCVVYFKQVL
jgi:hypothetical protein